MPWTPEEQDLLRELFKRGYSYPAIAGSINDEFGTDYSDAACRGQAQRMALTNGGEERPSLGERRFEQVKIPAAKDGTRVLAFGDLQAPFHDNIAFNGFLRFAREFEPHYLMSLGDNADLYVMSDFDRAPARRNSLQDELDVTRRLIDRVEDATPGAKKYWVDGNHEDRLRRFLWRNAAQLADVRSLDPTVLLGLDSWRYMQYGSHVSFLSDSPSPVLFEHGDRVSQEAGATARLMMRKRGSSGVSGHTHRLATIHHQDAHRSYTWIENGCLCGLQPEYKPNPDWQHGFSYGVVKQQRLHMIAVAIYDGAFRAEGTWYSGR